MPELINITDNNRLQLFFAAFRERNAAFDAALLAQVGAIIDEVRTGGDAALLELTARFDGVKLTAAELRAPAGELRAAAALAPDEVRDALRLAISRLRVFHERQREESWSFTDETGAILGQRVRPLASVGLYVPGGTASYPSSVLMNVIPAQVAGAQRIAVATPPRAWRENPALAAALVELGVTEIYQIGGAQAIAALAFGTESVPRVDKITGPGNKYVTAAKKLVFGAVGIDSLAGPSEVVIIADETAQPSYVAADMLAQAEHGEDASAILLTTRETLARAVINEINKQLAVLPRQAIAAASLRNFGAVIVVEELAQACLIADQLAPEHLEIMTADARELAEKINHAGAIFVGAYTPEALGDYLAGPNHVLPTGGTARFASALGVYDFVKRTSLLEFSPEAMRRLAAPVEILACSEGLQGHAQAAAARL
jgi:histidinol dehydrogenase